MKFGGQILRYVLLIFKISCLMGKRLVKDVLGNHSVDRLFLSSLVECQFGEKVLPLLEQNTVWPGTEQRRLLLLAVVPLNQLPASLAGRRLRGRRDSCPSRTHCTSPGHQLRGRFGPTCALSGWPSSKLDQIESSLSSFKHSL